MADFLARPVPATHLRINSCGWSRCQPDWRWDSSRWSRPDFDLWVVLDGSGRMETPDGEIPFARGDCFLLRGTEFYRGHQDPGLRLLVSHTHFDLLDQRGKVRRPARKQWPPLHRRMDDVACFEGLLRRMYEANLADADGELSRGWLAAALLELCRQDRRVARGDRRVQGHDEIQALCAEIVEDPGRGWTVAGMARRCHCSPDHFSRLFRRATGVAPQEFCVRVRLQRAAALLRYDRRGIGEIAAELGYRDVHFFSRQFKSRMGSSPSRYRERG